MDPGFLYLDNFGRMAIIVGFLLAAPFFAYAGFLFMSSMGDPNRSAQARNSVISVFVGVAVIGLAYLVPLFVSDAVIAPSGGTVYELERGVNCDGILRDQLVANRQASDAGRIQFVITSIQTRFEDCNDIFWTPLVREDPVGEIAGCFEGADNDLISGVRVPRGLLRGGEIAAQSGRDDRNNIIVHWEFSPGEGLSGLPSDGSICWMYVSSLGSWVEGYLGGSG